MSAQPTILETISLPSKLKPDIARRVEMLGKLNDRRVRAMAAGDDRALLKLAAEYEKKKMPSMANWVRQYARVRSEA
jgi:hypothetical protein